MKKILPIFFSLAFFVVLLFTPFKAYSQTPTPLQTQTTTTATTGDWVQDPNVTFVGKTAARSGQFLDWALRTYDWSAVPNGQTNPLLPYWRIVLGIVTVFLLLFVLVTAFVVVITRGRSITIKKFIPRFVGIVILIVLSYSLIQFIYQITDSIQGFFLRNPTVSVASQYISTKNLLNVAFQYQDFVGYRRLDSSANEAAFMSLILVKFTAVTYYMMVGVLLLRKIILWFFIIVSPIFPLLLLYYPVRNTGKIWIGEFFRWLLYAPLFAIFLQGLVRVWSSVSGIPLAFDFVTQKPGSDVVYPTAINILLGGPGQQLSLNNSVNLPDTFALYVVALLMLWVVIVLPFILLQIFLDYLHNFSFADSPMMQQIVRTSNNVINKVAPPPVSPPPLPPIMPRGAGMARTIPLHMSEHRAQTAEILKQTNISVPTLADIARFETSTISKDAVHQQQAQRVKETLGNIANPTRAALAQDKTRFVVLKEKLNQEQQKGNPVAASILSAAKVASGQKTDAAFPIQNRVQSVSIEDYEAVKKMWKENYENLDVPNAIGVKDREGWIKQDQEKIQLAMNLLASADVTKQKQAMDMVGQILPFLLIGGFSQSEVTAYLKAKLEAGKAVLSEVEKKEQEEASLLPRAEKKEEEKTMTASEEANPFENVANPEVPPSPKSETDKNSAV